MPQGITGIVGKDVLTINGQVIIATGDGDAIKLDPQGPIAQMKVSKDGNSVYALANSGIACKLAVKLVRGSFDDITLNGYLQQWLSDPASFSLLSGSYVKRMGDGKGNSVSDIYTLSGGLVEQIPPAVGNSEGSTEQGYVTYTLLFRNDVRLHQ